MTYDFDTIINRYGTDSAKYDTAKRYGKPEDIIPLWVADMDFQSPKEVLEALARRAEHGVFGYTGVPDDYNDVIAHWFASRFNFHIQPEWLIRTPGVIFAVCAAIYLLQQF